MLLECYHELDGNKATGIDDVTKEMYGVNLESNLKDLVCRLKNRSYKPLPTLRVYIPKANGKLRPLGIASYEDKIVQLALKKILEAIYEPRFLNCMYGFRPNRSCHDAVRYARNQIQDKRINYVVDADIKGFFDHVNHEWMMRFLELYIKDTNLLWLIKKYLTAGVIDKNVFKKTEEGTVQGNIISPILANIYMHNVLTLWYKFMIMKNCKGDNFIVAYADDFIAGFQYGNEAKEYYHQLKERMEKFSLELESNKSRLIPFSKWGYINARKTGTNKPATFNFLGFTFYSSSTRNGSACVKLKTDNKKFHQKIKNIKTWIGYNRHIPVADLIKLLNRKLKGHYNYYGVSFNSIMLRKYFYVVRKLLFKYLNKRSQKKSYTWEEFLELMRYCPLEEPHITVKLF